MLGRMNPDALPEDWETLRSWLPADLDARARQHGFFQRARGLNDGERWLRLILMHVAGGLSLEQTALRARELGLAEISGVALFKRLRRGSPPLPTPGTTRTWRHGRSLCGPWAANCRTLRASISTVGGGAF